MKQQYDSIIFDMDGVLVSNASYVRAIQMTVERVLWEKFRLKKNVCREYITAIKQITGFNNDWDTSYALIQLLGRGVPLEKFRNVVKCITPETRRSFLYQTMKDIFQAYYLGNNNDGLIISERLLMNRTQLTKLASRYKLGIATSRPRFEALFAAVNLNLTPQLIEKKFIVAKEDARREKPFPDPLLEVQNRMKARRPIYVGDTINDVIAARNAKMPCIFIGSQRLGDMQIQKPSQLMEVLYE